jgi:MFS family permease
MSELTSDGERGSPSSIYSQAFWLAFTANLLLVTANTMTFRFAEFVRLLGGTEEITGRIISLGLVGSLIWRLALGQAIDRFGVRAVWGVSALAYVAGSFSFLMSDSIGIVLYAGRLLFAIGIANMFTSALAYVQNLAPPERRTEVIGSYGAAGFLGMILGAQLGDLVFGWFPASRTLYFVLFGITIVLGIGHGLLAMVMTRGIVHVPSRRSQSLVRLYRKYWPNQVLIASTMMGLVVTVTTIFVTRYATSLGLPGIRTFFSAYAITAFIMRIVTRSWSRTFGRHRMIVFGLAGHALGLFALLGVSQDWHFILAALCFGFGHAVLFPCVVSLGAGAFPERYRGTGTNISLGVIDIGTIVSAPVIGLLIDSYGFQVSLFTAAMVIALASLTYAALGWHLADSDIQPLSPRAAEQPGLLSQPVLNSTRVTLNPAAGCDRRVAS